MVLVGLLSSCDVAIEKKAPKVEIFNLGPVCGDSESESVSVGYDIYDIGGSNTTEAINPPSSQALGSTVSLVTP